MVPVVLCQIQGGGRWYGNIMGSRARWSVKRRMRVSRKIIEVLSDCKASLSAST